MIASKIILTTVSAFSLVAALAVVVLICVFGRAGKPCWRAVLYACISEIIFTASMMFGDESLRANATLCNAQAVVIGVSSLAITGWLLYIALQMFILVKRKESCLAPFADFLLSWRFEVLWWVLVLALAVGTAIMPLLPSSPLAYGYQQIGYCHYERNPSWGRLMMYAQHWVALILLAVFYILTWRDIKYSIRRQRVNVILPQEHLRKREDVFVMLRQMYLYPLLLFLSWVPTTVVRLIDAFVDSAVNSILGDCILAAIIPLMGILILICFLASSNIIPQIRSACATGILTARSPIPSEESPLINEYTIEEHNPAPQFAAPKEDYPFL